MRGLAEALAGYLPRSAEEAADVERVRHLAATPDPWTRSSPLHVTGSALILHPATARVLLRWHARMQSWLQVGGHADPLETDPFQVAVREAREETSLPDLVAWPDPARPTILQVVVVPVPAGKGEPAHEHADVRYVLATAQPAAATPENPTARLQWLPLDAASELVALDNLQVALTRLSDIMRTA